MRYDGLAPDELRVRLGVPGCISVGRVTSTLDVIHELAEDDAPPGTLVLADEQVAGRGRLGREWHSAAGSGIWIGFLTRPVRGLESGVMALRVGITTAQALTTLGATVHLKWPNDIMLGNRKMGGVLCEARWDGNNLRWIAVGIGLNVSGAPKTLPEAGYLATALPGVSRLDVLAELAPRLLTMSQSATLSVAEHEEYSRRDWLIGKTLREPVGGVVEGIDSRGGLLVRSNRGTERAVGGSVVTE